MNTGLVTQKSSGIGQADIVKVTVLMDNIVPFSTSFTGEHGFSLYVEVIVEDHTRRIILDTGRTAENFCKNLKLANVPLEDIDLVYLSHCHYDHTGGLEWLLKEKKTDTTIVAHPALFRNTFKLPGEIKNVGIKSTPGQIENLGGKLYLTKDAFEILPGVVSSGEIVRVTDYEGKGIGAYYIDDQGSLTEDLIMDDMALIINVKGKGLLILVGCSHSGIINIVRHAKKITGVNEVCGIVGGFHLASAKDERITKTVDEMAVISPNAIYAGHCTGLQAMNVLSEKLGDVFQPLGAGMNITFNGRE